MSEHHSSRSRRRRRTEPVGATPDAPWRPSSRDRGARAKRVRRKRKAPRWLRRLKKRFLRWDRRLGVFPRGRFRWRFFRRTMIGVAVVLAAAWLWHWVLLSRSAAAILANARRAAAREPRQAAGLFDAYLKLFPNNLPVRIERAQAFDAQAKSPAEKLRALELYRTALAAKTNLGALNARMAQLEFELGRDDKALLHAEAAIAAEPERGAGWKYKGLAETRKFVRGDRPNDTAPLEALEKAAELLPGDVEIAATLAGALRREGMHWSAPALLEKADRLLDRTIGLDPLNPKVWLARYAYRVTYNLPDAASDLEEALAHSPDDLEALLATGREARRQKNYPLATAVFVKAAELSPGSGRAHLGRALAAYEAGQREDAIAGARRALGPTHHDPWLVAQLSEWLVAAHLLDEADTHLSNLAQQLTMSGDELPAPQRRGLEITTRFIQSRSLMARNKFPQATETLKSLVYAAQEVEQDELAPLRALQIHYSLAECYAKLDDWPLAAEQFEAAAELQPTSALHQVRAGEAWEKGRRPDFALRRFQRALQIDPSLEDVAKHVRRLNAVMRGAAPAEE